MTCINTLKQTHTHFEKKFNQDHKKTLYSKQHATLYEESYKSIQTNHRVSTPAVSTQIYLHMGTEHSRAKQGDTHFLGHLLCISGLQKMVYTTVKLEQIRIQRIFIVTYG